MKRYIRSSKIEAASLGDTWYRCVRKGSPVDKFMPFELGIHMGSYELAKKVNEEKYNNSGDIYEIHIDSGCIFSNPVSDFEVWSSVEAVSEILSKGFGLDVSKAQIINDFRSGALNKNTANDYIVDYLLYELGDTNAAVVYHNNVELDEDDIIVLDSVAILDATKVD